MNNQKLKILVADNDELIRCIMESILNALGHKEISMVSSRVACLEIYNPTYDIIFLDIHMPSRNRFDTLKELMQIDPDAHIVALSVDRSFKCKEQTLKLGASGIIIKPITLGKVYTQISKYYNVKELSSNKYF